MKTDSLPSDLIVAAGQLKIIKRSGWLRKVGITSDRESVADHSFRMAIIGMERGLEMGLDSSKIVRMCLIHDLAESVLGDRMPEEKKSAITHRQDEDRILQELLGTLRSKSKKVLLADWSELLESKTKEAKLVWRIDKLEMALQARDYERMGYDRKKLFEFTKTRS